MASPLVSAEGRGWLDDETFVNAAIQLARRIAGKRGRSPYYAPKNAFLRWLFAAQHHDDVMGGAALPCPAGRA